MVRDLTVNQTYTEMLWGFESLPNSTTYLNIPHSLLTMRKSVVARIPELA